MWESPFLCSIPEPSQLLSWAIGGERLTVDINWDDWDDSEANLELLAKEVPQWMGPPGRTVVALAGQLAWGKPRPGDPKKGEGPFVIQHRKTVDGVLLHEAGGRLGATIIEFKTDEAALTKGLGQGLRYWWQPMLHGEHSHLYAEVIAKKVGGSLRKRLSLAAPTDLTVPKIAEALRSADILVVDGSGRKDVARKETRADSAALAKFISSKWPTYQKGKKSANDKRYANLGKAAQATYLKPEQPGGAGVVIRRASARIWWPRTPLNQQGRPVYALVGALLLPEAKAKIRVVATRPGSKIEAKLNQAVDRLAKLLPDEPVAVGQAVFLGEDDLGCRWACRLLARPIG